ncbi:hypothetical protein PG995_014114 [Apiospora arundinis]
MFSAGATLAAAEVGAAAALKDEDKLVYPMLAAACSALVWVGDQTILDGLATISICHAPPISGTDAALAVALLKDEDKLVYPMLAAACFAVCSVLLSVRLSLAVPTNKDWLKDLSGFAVLFLVLSLGSTIITFFIWKPWALPFLVVIVPVACGLCPCSPGV